MTFDPAAVADLLERSKYTVKNGHAWTADDDHRLKLVIHDLLQAANSRSPRTRPRFSWRGLLRLRSRRG